MKGTAKPSPVLVAQAEKLAWAIDKLRDRAAFTRDQRRALARLSRSQRQLGDLLRVILKDKH